jgi:DNA invertase Pin-like site-specific DNA recombinase
MGTIIGYARVSTTDQNLDGQLDALRAAGAWRVFEDKASGATQDRPGWRACLEHLQPGNTLLVTDLTRLGRSTLDLAGIVQELGSRDVAFRSLAEPWLDTGSAHGRLIFDMFASIAAYERARLIERTREGLAAARARGRVGGRPSVMTPEKSEWAHRMRAEGMSLRKIAEALSVSTTTIVRDLAEQKTGRGM